MHELAIRACCVATGVGNAADDVLIGVEDVLVAVDDVPGTGPIGVDEVADGVLVGVVDAVFVVHAPRMNTLRARTMIRGMFNAFVVLKSFYLPN